MQTELAGEQTQQRLLHLQELKKIFGDPYQKEFSRTSTLGAVLEQYASLQKEEEGKEEVRVAGRIMAIRSHGKASFFDLVDASGKIQLYFKEDWLQSERYGALQYLDLGDLLGVTGHVFRTRRGELTIAVKEYLPLGKSLHPLPEKWHGLKEVEIRYRQRYLDLMVNPEVRKVFTLRSHLVRGIRKFLDEKGFLEVETPVMSSIAGGAEARPFATHHHALDMDLFLRIATELHLKRLIVGGFDKVYEVGRVFRNEGISTRHNPEYTLLELYDAYSNYEGMMSLVEEMLAYLAITLLGSTTVPYGDRILELKPPFARLTFAGALMQYGALDLSSLRDEEKVMEVARACKISLEESATRAHLLDKIFEEVVQPHLVQPTFIVDYPVELSPLARRRIDDPGQVYRFELFINNFEIANAFSELNDPQDQRERFLAQQQLRETGDQEAHMMDEDFVKALEYGMPPTGGMGIGIDRLCMLFSNTQSIREVILFPLLRPRKGEE